MAIDKNPDYSKRAVVVPFDRVLEIRITDSSTKQVLACSVKFKGVDLTEDLDKVQALVAERVALVIDKLAGKR